MLFYRHSNPIGLVRIAVSIRISKKCHYALRAVFELASRGDSAPVTVLELAKAQEMPTRFLEVILSELRQAGIVAARRGNTGGYTLAALPRKTTAAQVIEAIEGPIAIGATAAGEDEAASHFNGGSALEDLWTAMNESIKGICQDANFEDLVEREKRSQRCPTPDYSI